MGNKAEKFGSVVSGSLAPGEVVDAAFRAKFSGFVGTYGMVAPKKMSASKKRAEQVQTGWPTTTSADGGTFVGLTPSRILVTQPASTFRRRHDVNEVPLTQVTSARIEKGSPGYTNVVIGLANGNEALLNAFSRDDPDGFVDALNRYLGQRG